MPEPSPSRPPIGSLAIIAIVVAVGAGAFAYTAGWLSPTRLTPTKIVDSLAPPGGPSLGHHSAPSFERGEYLRRLPPSCPAYLSASELVL
jgi:hypothetical protein